MKKLKYIAILLVIVAASSCQKDNIMPVSGTTNSQPVWEDDALDNSGKSGNNNYSDKAVNTGDNTDSGVIITNTSGGDGAITDPNNDPDASKRKGKK